jgi:Arc/MetJ-type ribon-helix-helix transcriptional regulator
MTYQIPSDLELRIQAQLRDGQFQTAEDVLRAAMDTLERRQRGLQQVRQMVRESDADLAVGRVGAFDAERTKRQVRERLQM